MNATVLKDIEAATRLLFGASKRATGIRTQIQELENVKLETHEHFTSQSPERRAIKDRIKECQLWSAQHKQTIVSLVEVIETARSDKQMPERVAHFVESVTVLLEEYQKAIVMSGKELLKRDYFEKCHQTLDRLLDATQTANECLAELHQLRDDQAWEPQHAAHVELWLSEVIQTYRTHPVRDILGIDTAAANASQAAIQASLADDTVVSKVVMMRAFSRLGTHVVELIRCSTEGIPLFQTIDNIAVVTLSGAFDHLPSIHVESMLLSHGFLSFLEGSSYLPLLIALTM